MMPSPLKDSPYMDHHERMRLRSAAFRATRIYPGPVGEFVSRELLTWEEFGYRLERGGMVMAMVNQIMASELPRGSAR